MKNILEKLYAHQHLDREEARRILIGISQSEYNSHQIAAFISVFLMRSLTVSELEGFREALLELCIPVSLDCKDAIDVCGTGGDGKNTFNISTLTAMILAGAGKRVVKHGNYGVSSVCGSSNVLEYLGHKFPRDSNSMTADLDRAGICILHAPLFHPALKSVAPVRRDLGVKTFFNMLGPLVNPAQPGYQMVGVFDLKVARLYQYMYERFSTNKLNHNGAKHYAILHALDGYDEISLTGNSRVVINGVEKILTPEDFGLSRLSPKCIYGGSTVKEAADIFIRLLKGEETKERESVVLANAALALQLYHPDRSLLDCVAQARQSLDSGQAYQTLKALIN